MPYQLSWNKNKALPLEFQVVTATAVDIVSPLRSL
jgi:hypothetical protein